MANGVVIIITTTKVHWHVLAVREVGVDDVDVDGVIVATESTKDNNNDNNNHPDH